MDLQNFADYQFFQMFFGNTDNGNIRFWRTRGPEGRWRWILYDLDTGFSNVTHRSVAHVTNPQGTGAKRRFSTVLLRTLLDNPDFRELFLTRASLHLGKTLAPTRVRQRVDALAAAAEPEIAAESKRWGVRNGKWAQEIALMRRFAAERPNEIRRQIVAHFQLSEADQAHYGLEMVEALP